MTLNTKKPQKLVRCCSYGQVACGLGVINSCVPFSDVRQLASVLKA